MVHDTITREELHAALQRGDDLVLIEALGPMYFEDAHLPGAINIPHISSADIATPAPIYLKALRRALEEEGT